MKREGHIEVRVKLINNSIGISIAMLKKSKKRSKEHKTPKQTMHHYQIPLKIMKLMHQTSKLGIKSIHLSPTKKDK